jgi:hypothetical protein
MGSPKKERPMIPFRIFLVALIVVLVGYTGMVGATHGWDLFPIFFGDILARTWPGQFNLDFACLLLLSGLWIAWRSHFSIGGVMLGLLGAVGGTAVLAPYLLVASFQTRGDIKALLLGPVRAGH